ncbi:MAG: hypothetical protein ACFB5Z_20505 [Elainellaceae cyanobacterium]
MANRRQPRRQIDNQARLAGQAAFTPALGSGMWQWSGRRNVGHSFLTPWAAEPQTGS